MKAIKIYLFIVTILLLLALSAGVYVWFVIQDVQGQKDQVIQEDTPVLENSNQDTAVDSGSKEPIVIDVETLPESQQDVLKTFGFEGETVTITAAMISCAEDAVGKVRFDAIVEGASPSPLESLKLLPCLKK